MSPSIPLRVIRRQIIAAFAESDQRIQRVSTRGAANDVWVEVFQHPLDFNTQEDLARALHAQADSARAFLTAAGYKIDRVEPDPSWPDYRRWIFIDVEHARAKILQERAARAEAKARTFTVTKLEEELLAACRIGTKEEALKALAKLWGETRG